MLCLPGTRERLSFWHTSCWAGGRPDTKHELIAQYDEGHAGWKALVQQVGTARADLATVRKRLDAEAA